MNEFCDQMEGWQVHINDMRHVIFPKRKRDDESVYRNHVGSEADLMVHEAIKSRDNNEAGRLLRLSEVDMVYLLLGRIYRGTIAYQACK